MNGFLLRSQSKNGNNNKVMLIIEELIRIYRWFLGVWGSWSIIDVIIGIFGIK